MEVRKRKFKVASSANCGDARYYYIFAAENYQKIYGNCRIIKENININPTFSTFIIIKTKSSFNKMNLRVCSFYQICERNLSLY